MKKILTILISITMLCTIFLSSCKEEKEIIKESFSINENGELIVTYSDGTKENLGKITANAPRGIKQTYINDAGEMIITYTDGEQENIGLVVSENVWRERNDTIYAKGPFKLKTQPDDSFIDNINITVSMGTELARISTNGTWNKIIYNEKEYYIKSEYTTTNKDFITFQSNIEHESDDSDTFVESLTKTVYSKRGLKLYNCPCKDQSMMATAVPENIEMTQTEINKTGDWIKVRYGDYEYYCEITDISYEKAEGLG